MLDECETLSHYYLMKIPHEFTVEHYQGSDDYQQVLWQCAHILDHHLHLGFYADDTRPPATWTDGDGRLCELSSEVVYHPRRFHFFRQDYDAYYNLTRTESGGRNAFSYVISSQSNTIEQRNRNGELIPQKQRMPESLLYKNILESFDWYKYDTILQRPTDPNEIDEKLTFDEIAYHYERDTRLRRIGRGISSLVR